MRTSRCSPLTAPQDCGRAIADPASRLPGSTMPGPGSHALLSELVGGPNARIDGTPASDWWLPGPARLLLSTGTVSIQIRKRQFASAPGLSLVGPTDRAHRLVVEGGSIVSAAITPLGWARLSRRGASTFRNLVVPAGDALRAPLAARLADALDARGEAFHDRCAALLAETSAHRDEALVLRLAEMVQDPASGAVRDLHDTLGISEARLRALALRHFGAPTKILLRRARFLRSLALVDYRAGHNSYTVIDPSYHDVSHFLRDAHYFLGTTPRRFRLLSSRH
jgi:hypothetical protein